MAETEKVLVVESERHLARLTQERLQRLGRTVVTAQDAREALVMVEMEKPSTILVRAELPGRKDLVLTLKANPATRSIPIVDEDWFSLPPVKC